MTSMPHDGTWPRVLRPARALRLRAHAPLAGLLVLTAVLYLWGLSRSGYANDFYAAAVKAGTQSWKAFLFGSLDRASYITVDKPPASLWAMELSGRLLGFSSFSMLLPQALEGIAAVGLLYAAVRRWFGTPAALLAGLVLALTPVAALMFRFNNPDAMLLLLLVAAAYGTVRALERGSTRWLALAGGAVGFGFLAKMLEAFLVVPAFALVYLLAAPTPFRRRVGQLLVAGVALLVSAGWWVAIVELVPASARPYVGGSTNDSILDLIWGYNGLGRIEGGTGGPGGGGAGFSGSPGILRLFNASMGSQISWLLPAALLVLVVGLAATVRAPRTDRLRSTLLLWGGWLVVAGGTFSFMSGVIHPYYTNVLAAPIAVLLGAGGAELWRRREQPAARAVLAAAIAATAWWSYRLLERTPEWHPALRYAVLAEGIAAALAALVVHRLPREALAVVAAAGALAVFGGMVGTTASTVATPHTGAIVSAGPTAAGGGFGSRGGFAGGPGGGQSATTSTALATLLRNSPSSYTWAAATTSSQGAAPLELATGKAVMALGGFTGSDDAISLAAFRRLVAAGKVHYFVAGGFGGGFGRGGGFGGRGGPGGGSSSVGEISSWVASTFTPTAVGGTTVYDLTS